MYEERVGSNIEGKTQEAINRALIQLAREFIIGDVKLEKTMTRRKSHLVSLRRVISDDEIATTIWIFLASINHFLYLINAFAIEISPLVTIDGSELTPLLRKIGISFYFFNKIFHLFFPFWSIFWIFFCEIIFFEIRLKWPFIPDSHIIVHEVFDIGITREEPEELMNNAFRKNFLGCQKRKSCL